jgi:lipoprotein-anchoring transpeptidase ErfK/SrfK
VRRPRTTSGPRAALIVAVAALGAAVLVAFVVSALRDGSGTPGTALAATASTVSPAVTTSSSSTTTTSVVVEQVVLPAGVREVATVRPELGEVVVRRTPPAGWDRRLTPVVTPSGPEPPRSALDRDRVALPNEQQSIVGRAVTPKGWVFANPTSYQPPQPLVFGVVQRQGDWLEVQLPVRPNGTTGWIRSSRVTLTSTTMSVQVSLSERRLRVIDAGAVLMDVPAGIGRPATPTPTGSFTVTDIVPSANPAGGYGPVALALDGYSEVMDSFAGESGVDAPDATVPVLAVHGTNQPSSVGQAQSNGCPRLYNDDVLRVAAMVPAGTPVQIWP